MPDKMLDTVQEPEDKKARSLNHDVVQELNDEELTEAAGGSPANAICFKCWLPKWACRCPKRPY